MLGCIDHKRALGGVSVFTEISDQEALSCNLENQYLLFFFLPQIKHQNLLFRKLLRFRSVTQLCPTLCDPMDCSTPGLPIHHQLPELAQTHVHWVGDAIQSSHPLVPFSSCLHSSPAWGSFPASCLFTSGGQNTGVSTSSSVLPINIQDWFPLGWMGWISLQFKGLSSLLQHHSSKASILRCSAFFTVQLSHPYMTTGKTLGTCK